MAEIKTSIDGAVATVLFSNPAKMNAMSYDMWHAVPKVFAQLDANPAVRVIVCAGEGEKAFISGADISQFEKLRGTVEAQIEYNKAVEQAYGAPTLCSKPVVARIRGICIGGGLAIAASADMRIAAEDARLALPPARLGIGYHMSGVEGIVSMVGPSAASEIFFTARQYTAPEALRIGLVNQVVPKADLQAFAEEYAAGIAANAPLTLRAAKRAIREAQRDAASRDHEAVRRLIAACFSSQDYAEGVRAFLEKRAPRFRGA